MQKSLFHILVFFLATVSLNGCHPPHKRVLVIHSYAPNYAAYEEYNRLIINNFHRAGVKADLSFFYLDCEQNDEKAEITKMKNLLDSITPWHPDIILLNDDQATYSTLKTYHPLLRTIPLVFTGVNYPNWELLKEYSNITGFQDKIDIRSNLELIKKLTGKSYAHTVLDYTFIDRKVRADINEQLKDGDYISNVDFQLSPLEAEKESKNGKFVLAAFSIRNPGKNWLERQDSLLYGVNILWSLSKYNTSPYLQTKFDFTTETIAGFSTSNRFTAINELFGCGYSFLGGYMTPLSNQVSDLVHSAIRILKGEAPESIPIEISQKEYLIDWIIMQKEGLKNEDIPKEYKIINIPYKAQSPILWNIIVWGSGSGLTFLFIILIFLYIGEARKKHQMKRELAEERKFLSLAIKGSNTYAWKIEKNSFIFEKDFLKAQHLPTAKMQIDTFSHYIHPKYRHICNILLQESEIGENRIELQCNFNGKGYRWWELRYSIIEDASEGKNIAGLLLDIEDYKTREKELIEARELAEQAELKQSFLANMSHEIRTPLNAIVGFSNILASGDEPIDIEEQKQYVDLINSNSELLLKLINDILEISRIESGYMSFEYARHTLQPLMDEVYQTHKMLVPEQLQFIHEYDPVPVYLFIDNNRLKQVLTNLISNACKFTKNGYIKLGYRHDKNRKKVEIFVEDSGIGIPKKEQKMIFNRFYKQNEFAQGTGLGLSICRVIIEKLNGEITLQSEPGKGSRFSVFLDCE